MGIARPTGGYAGQMLDPGGWPDADEDASYDRALAFTEALRHVTDVLETCQRQQVQVFEGSVWSGGAASAANGELHTNIGALTSLQHGIATVITWHQHIAAMIEQAKSAITDNSEVGHQQIAVLQNDPGLDAAERDAAISTVVTATHAANVSVVTVTAEQIVASSTWAPPKNALQDLLDRKTPPPYVPPDDTSGPATPSGPGTPSQGAPSGGRTPGLTPPSSTPPSLTPPSLTPPPNGGPPSPESPPTQIVSPLLPGLPPAASLPMPPAASLPMPPSGLPVTPPGSPASRPGRDPSADADTSDSATPDDGSAVPLSPAASAKPPSGADGGHGKGLTPASFTGPLGGAPRGDDASPAVAPAAATGQPPASMSSGIPGGAAPAAAASGSRGRSRAPAAAARPLGPPPTPKPAGPSRTPTKAPGTPNPPERVAPDVVAVAAIPVSAARAERDAIAAAATAEAARRRGTDPVQLARRVAAALNAQGTAADDFGFFWVTAVTTDGAIVVANSYGIAYIPDGVHLPDPVHMASAEDSIPAAVRASWATYPLVAVQGWAAARDTTLRVVIATEQQFAGSDPGAAKVVLTPDDIPDSGDMAGRSRLEVVNPDAAQLLSVTDDTQLFDLVPPAPAQAGPPIDPALVWLDVIKPLMSRASGREAAHLRAFRAYAAAARDTARGDAHEALDPAARRAAITNWFYWNHLIDVLNTALADGT